MNYLTTLHNRPHHLTVPLKAVAILLIVMALGCSPARGRGKVAREADARNTQDDLSIVRHREQRFGEGSIPKAEREGLLYDIRFELDSAELTPDAQQIIATNAKILSDSSFAVTLEGHCDDRGTTDYNLALGQRRAQAVLSYLVSLGIPSSRLSTVSYGENIPLDSRPTEGAWAVNRRVHFGIGQNEAVARQIAPATEWERARPPEQTEPGIPTRRRFRPLGIPLQEGAIDSGE
jgi:peptidoglycan-associated lipoprotein